MGDQTRIRCAEMFDMSWKQRFLFIIAIILSNVIGVLGAHLVIALFGITLISVGISTIIVVFLLGGIFFISARLHKYEV